MKKEDIRLCIKAHKSLLSDSEKIDAANQAFARLEKHASFVLANNILMYHSLADELSTIAFLDKWHNRKQFFLPRVNGVNLDILPYDQSTLKLGAFQIEEPQGDNTVDISQIELIIVPAIAYDRSGNRVGRGKGFYDRLLANSKATKVGVAYDFQLVDQIDAEPHDVGVDVIITDKCVINIKKPRKKKI